MPGRCWWIAVAATIALGLASSLAVLAARNSFTWGQPELPKAQAEALRPFHSNPSDTRVEFVYREGIERAVIREPQNTWSNLVFVFAGCAIFAHDRRALSRVLAAALVALGVASGLYHASLLPFWRGVDVAMMGWTIFALITVAIDAIVPTAWSARSMLRWTSTRYAIGAAGCGLAIVVAVYRNDVRIFGLKPFGSTLTTGVGIAIVGLLILLGAIATGKPIGRRLGIVVALTAAAVVCQLGDHPGHWLSRPDKVIQAHALWHVLMGASAMAAYDLFAVIGSQRTLFTRVT